MFHNQGLAEVPRISGEKKTSLGRLQAGLKDTFNGQPITQAFITMGSHAGVATIKVGDATKRVEIVHNAGAGITLQAKGRSFHLDMENLICHAVDAGLCEDTVDFKPQQLPPPPAEIVLPDEFKPLLATATGLNEPASPYGHISSLEGCTWHYGRGTPEGNELTITAPAGKKIGFNIGDLLRASLHLKTFAEQVARLDKYDSGDITADPDDAMQTLDGLIEQARKLVNVR
jgi:hypothetical protein